MLNKFNLNINIIQIFYLFNSYLKSQMKSNSDLQRMFESIHKDATQVNNQKKVESMDLS